MAVRDVNVVGTGGLVPIPRNLDSLSLYAVMPDKDGNLWWTTNDGVVGALKPDNTVTWIDYNDLNGDGIRRNPRSPRYERVAASHSVDQGDSARGASGAYMVSTHRMRRMGLGATGNVQIVWSARYPRGIRAKPGQVNRGSGTSPTVFNMAGRRFVVISDNAERMGVVVFRTERRLRRGETRQFARVVPFGRSRKVANENSHIAYPDGPRGMWIYVENNYGYTGPAATLGRRVTEPGFARIALRADGTVRVASLNKTIRIPSVVSQASLPSKTIYTYNKTARGWFLTALDARNVNRVVFRTLVARTGLLQLIDPNETLLRAYGPDLNTRNLGVLFNNSYSALNVAPDTSVWIGTLFGFVRVAPRDA
jgi:hypothetical protein